MIHSTNNSLPLGNSQSLQSPGLFLGKGLVVFIIKSHQEAPARNPGFQLHQRKELCGRGKVGREQKAPELTQAKALSPFLLTAQSSVLWTQESHTCSTDLWLL